MRTSHLAGFVAVVAAAALIAPPAGATLKKYRVQFSTFSDSTNNSPNPDFNPSVAAPTSRAVIDDSGDSPVLKNLLLVSDSSITTFVPELGGFIYTSRNEERGPTGEFTGTGSIDTTIAWGLLTGWTTTGAWWCNSSPSFICGLANSLHQESSEPLNLSSFYDMGTWAFHGTGWTGTPWIYATFQPELDPGNQQYFARGVLVQDGSIPALPMAGLAVLGGALVLGGLGGLRRRSG